MIRGLGCVSRLQSRTIAILGGLGQLGCCCFLYLTEATRMELEKLTAEERLIAEKAILNFRSLNKACDDAKDGSVLAVVYKPSCSSAFLLQRTLARPVPRA